MSIFDNNTHTVELFPILGKNGFPRTREKGSVLGAGATYTVSSDATADGERRVRRQETG
jgi:hypothetical protein